MRSLRIFLLFFESVLEFRATNLIWFLVSLINPLILLIYWVGYYKTQNLPPTASAFQSIITYYLLLAVVGSLLMSHIEEDVAYNDIQLGELTQFLIRPVSYFKIKLIGEMPWRIIQGFYGIGVFIVCKVIFGRLVLLNISISSILMFLLLAILAYLLSFYFKMLIGLSAMWLVEFSGLQQLVEVVILLLGGYIMPLYLYPAVLKNIAYLSPFSYIIYFPLIALQGRLNLIDFFKVISGQICWILIFFYLLRIFWRKGLRKFTGVGN